MSKSESSDSMLVVLAPEHWEVVWDHQLTSCRPQSNFQNSRIL